MQVLTARWWKAALIRAVKTVAQTLAAGMGCYTLIEQIDLKVALSMAGMAGLCSLLTSIGGIPEVDLEEKCNIEK